MKSTMVSVRLNQDTWTRYMAAAQSLGIPLATYLRSRLEQEDQLRDHQRQLEATMTTFLRTVEQSRSVRAAPAGPAGEAHLAPGVLAEMLLLLRMVAGPQNATVAQKEVERRGLKAWS